MLISYFLSFSVEEIVNYINVYNENTDNICVVLLIIEFI